MRSAAPDVVSVVVPTTLRPDLVAALRSIHEQSVATEVIVVVDASEAVERTPEIDDALAVCDRVLFTGGGAGAATARNRGVEAASGRWIAYLDDDDEWLPGKLERQVAVAAAALDAGASHVVVGTQARQRWTGRPELSPPVPAKVYRGGMSVAEYLFVRRAPAVTRASIWLPSLLVDADLARIVPWDAQLSRHQDWDWLTRAALVEGVTVEQIDEPLCVVHVGSSGSISASADWRASLEWAQALRVRAGERVYADFIAGQVLRYALQARSARGAATAVRESIRFGPPTFPSLALGLSGLVGRRQLEALMWLRFRVASRRPRG